MKTILIEIFEVGTDYRKGRLSINNKELMFTLEHRDTGLTQMDDLNKILSEKQKGYIAIPYGTYNVVNSYSPKFKVAKPHIQNVPGFDNILIHQGNSIVDSEGCVLVGCTESRDAGWIGGSIVATLLLRDYICNGKDEPIVLTIKKSTLLTQTN